MTERVLISDEEVRLQALDAETSFLIQAPAGSGKTELLTQRLLRLLSVVSRPEEILAITFTQKAAAEMRERVEVSLALALKKEDELADYLQVTRKLAVAALANAEAQGWPLLQSLDRLRIMTLDAFNRSLINAAPASSTLGGAPEPVSEHAASLIYQQTASDMLSWINRKDALGEQAAALFGHVDDETTSWRRSFETLLQSREQWLPLIGVIDQADSAQLRKALETTLEKLVSGPLRRFDQMLDANLKVDLARLLSGAAERLRDAGKYKNHLEPFLINAEFPQPDADELPKWQAIATALTLANDKGLRNQVTVRDGFAANLKDEKAALMAVLEQLRSNPKNLARLIEIKNLPSPRFEDEHWDVLMALLQLLPNAVAQLSNQFERRGVADYSELARAARAVLGTSEAPTDLALSLDYRIRHILVDEMQDTSISQYALLEALTLGWEPDDGRTLFCVGDPMQSIYRFRQAEVSRFLLAGEQGIGALPLVALRLTRNFRSAPALVNWCNQSFGEIFPEVADIALAAVRHSPSLPAVSEQPDSGVEIHPVIGADHEIEAKRVLGLIKTEIAAGSTDIAVLVRARPHLSALIPLLQDDGIKFDSVEIDPLHLRGEVRLLMAITLALMHAGDRLNWLAILRSPWVGMSLAELHQFCLSSDGICVPDMLRDESRISGLSEDVRKRLERLRNLLDDLALRVELRLVDQVETLWLGLGGAQLLEQPDQVANVYRYLDVLAELTNRGDYFEPTELDAALESKRVSALGNADVRIQLMTMYKAKGLEFESVILMGLGRGTRNTSAPLLDWLTLPRAHGDAVALISLDSTRATDSKDPIHKFLGDTNARKAAFELDRLLYVACTRAKRRLHLVGMLGFSSKGELRKPISNSLLAHLWPVCESDFVAAAATSDPEDQVHGDEAMHRELRTATRRASFNSKLLRPSELPLPSPSRDESQSQMREYRWVGGSARATGTAVHRWLDLLSQCASIEEGLAFHREHADRHESLLLSVGVHETELDQALNQFRQSINNCFANERACWVLFGQHKEAFSELGLSYLQNGQLKNLIIDRVFVAQDGDHWIVDYKSSSHEGGGREEFIANQVLRYRGQLSSYASAYEKLCGVKARTALYMPLLDHFEEVSV